MTTTKAGYELADRLSRYVGWTSAISATCSELARLGRKYERIQERWCNDEMDDDATARLQVVEARLETRIAALAATLPDHESGRWVVQFDGDPRGYTSRLVAPDGTEVGIA